MDIVINYHLKDIRLNNNMTLRELAALSGVSKTEINDIENGKSQATIEVLYRLSLALKIPLLDLFSVEISN